MLLRRLALSGVVVAAIACGIGGSARGAAAESAAGLVGVAKVDITPEGPVRMYGYGARTVESTGVAGRLKAAALAIGSDTGDGPAVLLCVDCGAVPKPIQAELFRRLAAKTALKPERFMLCNSHTHAGPDLDGIESFAGGQRARLDRYVQQLTGKLEAVVLSALAARKPGRLAWTQGKVGFATNRRVLKDGKWAGFGAVPEGAADHTLPLLRVTDAGGNLVAVVVNYACHNTTLRGDFTQIHGDWAGCAQEAIEADHPGTTALVTIGCGADSDPCPHGTVELCRRHGRALADEVKRLLAGPFTPVAATVQARMAPLEVPYGPAPSRQQLADVARYSYPASQLLKRLDRGGKIPATETYRAAAWTFGNDLAMVFLSNEVAVDYALRLRRELDGRRLWINAYTNDVSTYVVSDRLIREGGYEVSNSFSSLVTYGWPDRLQPSMEERIVRHVKALLPARPEPSSWRLATDDTRIEIAVEDDQVVVRALGCPREAFSWLAGPSRLPLLSKLWIDGRETTAHWRFQKAALECGDSSPLLNRTQDVPSPSSGELRGDAALAKALKSGDESPHSKRSLHSGRLTLTFSDDAAKLLLRSIWQARPGRGPIEHWLQIQNRSGRRVTVGQQESLSLAGLRPDGPAELWWIRRGGSNASTQGGTFREPLGERTDLKLASNCTDGSSPVPWLAVQTGQRRGLYVGWEFSGLGRVHARAERPGQLRLDVGNHPEFKTDIEPGETLQVPPAFVGCYSGDIDAGSHSLHRFVIEKLRPAPPPGCPDPILAYNLYLDVGGNQAKEADVLRSAETCRQLGFEAFMPDAMWFASVGDWRWDPARFPRGVDPVQRFVHQHGMQMALWCAWTNGGVSADPGAMSVRGPVGRPEWFNENYPPDWRPGDFVGGRLCLGCVEAKEWAIRKTQSIVAQYKLDYLKHDIDPIMVACNKSGHRHRHGVDTSYWATLGYYEVQERLRKAFPNLLLENCSGGGHIKDFGVIRRTHYTVTTDTLSNLPDRQSIYDSTFALPPLVLQAYTYDNAYPVPGDEPDTYLWRSAMMGAWQIDPTDTPKWTAHQRESARRSAEVYRQWVRPILQDAYVHHILPRPDGLHWDGMFYFSPSLRKGTLYIFRPQSPERAQRIRLRGLEPGRSYWVWAEEGSIAAGVHGGQSLMDEGLAIELPAQHTSDLVYVADAGLGRPVDTAPPEAFQTHTAKARADWFTVGGDFSWTQSPKARVYRLRVAGDAQLREVIAEKTSYVTALSLEELPAGRELFWQVEAIGPGGRRAADASPRRLTTPRCEVPPGITFLSDLTPVKATVGADNPLRRDKNYYDKTVRIAGKPYRKALWTHAFPDQRPADVVYDLPPNKYAKFACDAGLDDASNGGSVQFHVLLDGKLAAQSAVLRPRETHRFTVDLAGAKQLTLRVLNGSDGYSSDHAAWGLPRLVAPSR